MRTTQVESKAQLVYKKVNEFNNKQFELKQADSSIQHSFIIYDTQSKKSTTPIAIDKSHYIGHTITEKGDLLMVDYVPVLDKKKQFECRYPRLRTFNVNGKEIKNISLQNDLFKNTSSNEKGILMHALPQGKFVIFQLQLSSRNQLVIVDLEKNKMEPVGLLDSDRSKIKNYLFPISSNQFAFETTYKGHSGYSVFSVDQNVGQGKSVCVEQDGLTKKLNEKMQGKGAKEIELSSNEFICSERFTPSSLLEEKVQQKLETRSNELEVKTQQNSNDKESMFELSAIWSVNLFLNDPFALSKNNLISQIDADINVLKSDNLDCNGLEYVKKLLTDNVVELAKNNVKEKLLRDTKYLEGNELKEKIQSNLNVMLSVLEEKQLPDQYQDVNKIKTLIQINNNIKTRVMILLEDQESILDEMVASNDADLQKIACEVIAAKTELLTDQRMNVLLGDKSKLTMLLATKNSPKEQIKSFLQKNPAKLLANLNQVPSDLLSEMIKDNKTAFKALVDENIQNEQLEKILPYYVGAKEEKESKHGESMQSKTLDQVLADEAIRIKFAGSGVDLSPYAEVLFQAFSQNPESKDPECKELHALLSSTVKSNLTDKKKAGELFMKAPSIFEECDSKQLCDIMKINVQCAYKILSTEKFRVKVNTTDSTIEHYIKNKVNSDPKDMSDLLKLDIVIDCIKSLCKIDKLFILKLISAEHSDFVKRNAEFIFSIIDEHLGEFKSKITASQVTILLGAKHGMLTSLLLNDESMLESVIASDYRFSDDELNEITKKEKFLSDTAKPGTLKSLLEKINTLESKENNRDKFISPLFAKSAIRLKLANSGLKLSGYRSFIKNSLQDISEDELRCGKLVPHIATIVNILFDDFDSNKATLLNLFVMSSKTPLEQGVFSSCRSTDLLKLVKLNNGIVINSIFSEKNKCASPVAKLINDLTASKTTLTDLMTLDKFKAAVLNDPELAASVVKQLGNECKFSVDDLKVLFAHKQNNLTEVLFRCFDLSSLFGSLHLYHDLLVDPNFTKQAANYFIRQKITDELNRKCNENKEEKAIKACAEAFEHAYKSVRSYEHNNLSVVKPLLEKAADLYSKAYVILVPIEKKTLFHPEGYSAYKDKFKYLAQSLDVTVDYIKEKRTKLREEIKNQKSENKHSSSFVDVRSVPEFEVKIESPLTQEKINYHLAVLNESKPSQSSGNLKECSAIKALLASQLSDSEKDSLSNILKAKYLLLETFINKENGSLVTQHHDLIWGVIKESKKQYSDALTVSSIVNLLSLPNTDLAQFVCQTLPNKLDEGRGCDALIKHREKLFEYVSKNLDDRYLSSALLFSHIKPILREKLTKFDENKELLTKLFLLSAKYEPVLEKGLFAECRKSDLMNLLSLKNDGISKIISDDKNKNAPSVKVLPDRSIEKVVTEEKTVKVVDNKVESPTITQVLSSSIALSPSQSISSVLSSSSSSISSSSGSSQSVVQQPTITPDAPDAPQAPEAPEAPSAPEVPDVAATPLNLSVKPVNKTEDKKNSVKKKENDSRGDLMESIKKGKQLRKVEKNKVEENKGDQSSKLPSQPSFLSIASKGLTNEAKSILERRKVVADEWSDDESEDKVTPVPEMKVTVVVTNTIKLPSKSGSSSPKIDSGSSSTTALVSSTLSSASSSSVSSAMSTVTTVLNAPQAPEAPEAPLAPDAPDAPDAPTISGSNESKSSNNDGGKKKSVVTVKKTQPTLSMAEQIQAKHKQIEENTKKRLEEEKTKGWEQKSNNSTSSLSTSSSSSTSTVTKDSNKPSSAPNQSGKMTMQQEIAMRLKKKPTVTQSSSSSSANSSSTVSSSSVFNKPFVDPQANKKLSSATQVDYRSALKKTPQPTGKR